MHTVTGNRAIVLLVLLVLSAGSCRFFPTSKAATPRMPEGWPKGELDLYLALQNGFDPTSGLRREPQRSAESSKAMIAGTSEPFAVHAGLDILRNGGNAADAAISTALSQIALTSGAAISYAGMMTALYYDASSGTVATLNAAYNTVRNEKNPLTIPRMGQHSGRTALVPGFMAGVQALHDRFGRLPFASLFGPAIWIAEHGIPTSPVVSGWISSQKDFITRLPGTKRIFTKSNGELYQTGDLLRQPELAGTLKQLARRGSSYMYTGQWARHFVEAVQREGGQMTIEDLAAYRPMWTESVRMPYRGYDVIALGPPNGGALTLASLKLAEVADLPKYGHYSRSPEALYYLIQISRLASAFFIQPPDRLRSYFPDIDPSPESVLTKATAEKLWAYIQRPDWPDKMAALSTGKPSPNHSAGIVVVDEQGNVAAMLHSINTVLWGSTGIFVDGVSIPDSAAFQQQMISRVGPGVRLPETTNPLLVLKRGKPVLASVAVGSALHPVTLQNIINVIDFGMDPKTAVDQPNTQGPNLGLGLNAPGKPEFEKEAIGTGEFSQSVLDGLRARGQAITTVPTHAHPGYWIGIQIDAQAHKLKGGVTRLLPALVEAY